MYDARYTFPVKRMYATNNKKQNTLYKLVHTIVRIAMLTAFFRKCIPHTNCFITYYYFMYVSIIYTHELCNHVSLLEQ